MEKEKEGGVGEQGLAEWRREMERRMGDWEKECKDQKRERVEMGGKGVRRRKAGPSVKNIRRNAG